MNTPPRRASTRASLPLDPILLRVLRMVSQHPHLSQRELAARTGVSLGKANYCLRALIEKGHLKVQNYRKSSNKLAYLYLLTPAGVKAKAKLTRRFLSRKLKEYEALRMEIEGLQRESEADLPTRNGSETAW